jgi:hypothetical protein
MITAIEEFLLLINLLEYHDLRRSSRSTSSNFKTLKVQYPNTLFLHTPRDAVQGQAVPRAAGPQLRGGGQHPAAEGDGDAGGLQGPAAEPVRLAAQGLRQAAQHPARDDREWHRTRLNSRERNEASHVIYGTHRLYCSGTSEPSDVAHSEHV